MDIIETKQGTYKFTPLEFSRGGKNINRKISKENLLILKNIFDQREIPFGLIYGTLLGAIRENNFIEHDEDTDIFILAENRGKTLDTLFDLKEAGFTVGRYTGELLSIIRNGEYIDMYFFERKRKKRICDGNVVEAEFLENLSEIPFLDSTFMVPEKFESLLISMYGEDWRTPKQNAPATNYGTYLRIKYFIRTNFLPLFKVISWAKKSISL